MDEWWHDMIYHSSVKMTPYEAMYGWKPLSMISYIPSTWGVHILDDALHTKNNILHILKDNMILSQNKMNQHVDKHRSKHSFEVGDYVFIQLQPYKHTSLKTHLHQNLSMNICGPYTILQCIG